MSTRPCFQVRARKIKHRCYAASTCLWALSLQVLGAFKGLPRFQAAGPSSAFLHRKEVAVQHRGVTAGTEVHRCLGVVGRLQREREVLCA